jgi:hypothetical protein
MRERDMNGRGDWDHLGGKETQEFKKMAAVREFLEKRQGREGRSSRKVARCGPVK